jgi:hypothetical protein
VARLVGQMWVMMALEKVELAAPEMVVSLLRRSAMRNWTVDAARFLRRSARPSLLAGEGVDPNQSACPRCILPRYLHLRR